MKIAITDLVVQGKLGAAEAERVYSQYLSCDTHIVMPSWPEFYANVLSLIRSRFGTALHAACAAALEQDHACVDEIEGVLCYEDLCSCLQHVARDLQCNLLESFTLLLHKALCEHIIARAAELVEAVLLSAEGRVSTGVAPTFAGVAGMSPSEGKAARFANTVGTTGTVDVNSCAAANVRSSLSGYLAPLSLPLMNREKRRKRGQEMLLGEVELCVRKYPFICGLRGDVACTESKNVVLHFN